MPKKSRRIAARQAQLSQRSRRKGQKGPSGTPQHPQPVVPQQPAVDQGPLEPEDALQENLEISRAGLPSPSTVAGAGQRTMAPSAPRLAPSRRARRAILLPAHLYVKRELLRIGLLTGAILAILVGLTFVLR